MTRKTLILLKNITCSDIDKKFNFINKPDVTDISEISQKNEESDNFSFTYLDESKKDHFVTISMINLVGTEISNMKTNIYCFWCRSSFDCLPIGCPIEYISHRIMKKYVSELTKDIYILRENISKHTYNMIQGNLDHISVYRDPFYLVDGVFCSFPCCLSYIIDHKTNPLYKNSESLLYQMYHEIHNSDDPPKFSPAPSWRLLDNFGGHMSIKQFRNSFSNTEYIDLHQSIQYRPSQKMIGFLYEKQIKL